MKNIRSIVLLIVLGILGGAPAALAYDDNLPAMYVREIAPHDGDPDDPTAFTGGGLVASVDQEGMGEKSEATTSWELWTTILLWTAGIAR